MRHSRTEHRWQYKMAHAPYVLDTQGYILIRKICNTYCFYTTKVLTVKRLNVTSNTHTHILLFLFPDNQNLLWIATFVKLTHCMVVTVNHTELITDNIICEKRMILCHFKVTVNNYIKEVRLIRLKVEWVWPACKCKWSGSPFNRPGKTRRVKYLQLCSFFKLSARWVWVFNAMPPPLYTR
jgi:hypothetical protein